MTFIVSEQSILVIYKSLTGITTISRSRSTVVTIRTPLVNFIGLVDPTVLPEEGAASLQGAGGAVIAPCESLRMARAFRVARRALE
jgi:hypothetical protein